MKQTYEATPVEYDAAAENVDDKIITNHTFPKDGWEKTRIDLILNNLKGDVLDVGTAGGTIALRRNLDSPSTKTIGLDFSGKVLKKAKKMSKNFGGNNNLQFKQGNAAQMPFKDKMFDSVVAADFTEHINDKQKNKFFKEAHRVLKSGGKIIIYTPNRGGYILSTLRLKISSGILGKGWNKYTIRFNKEAYEMFQYHHPQFVTKYNDIYNPSHFGVSFARSDKKKIERIGFKIEKIHFLAFEFQWFKCFWHFLSRVPFIRELFSNNYLLIAKKV